MAAAASTPMIAITAKSSTNVNPRYLATVVGFGHLETAATYFRRRKQTTAAMPRPISAKVDGSGTAVNVGR